jgi:hypothetical protein
LPTSFTFKTVMPPDESFLAALDWSIFAPCPGGTAAALVAEADCAL